jgi:hypothetical protein
MKFCILTDRQTMNNLIYNVCKKKKEEEEEEEHDGQLKIKVLFCFKEKTHEPLQLDK